MLAGCTTPPAAAPPAAQPSAQPAAAGSVLTLAGINALTGPSAAPGIRTQHGAELAVKDVNDAGGLKDNCGNTYSVRITEQDMGNDRNQAIALLRGDGDDSSVLAVVGPTPSVGLVPMVPVAGEIKMPVIGQGVAPIPEWNIYSYRSTTPRNTADLAMMTRLHNLGMQKLALIYDQAQDAEAASAQAIQDAASSIGYTVVDAEAFRSNDQDFSTQLTKIKASGAPWLGVLAAPGDMGKIARQIRDLGIDATLFASSGNFQDPVVWDTSSGAIVGGYTWSTFDFQSADPKVQQFLGEYKQNFPDDATLQSVWGYDAAQVAMDAAKRACTNTDRTKFAMTLGNTSNFQGLGGRITFKNPPDGENQSPDIIITKTTGRGTYEIVK
jgi:branched-chain amino acid transport system substrate-binding protein